jgi:23S rRNA (adenine2503-C2)-methyltransferase
MRIDDLLRRMRDLGAKRCHEERVLRAWLGGLRLDSGKVAAVDFLPLG